MKNNYRYAVVYVGRGRECLVDWDDVPLLKKSKWTCCREGKHLYAVRCIGGYCSHKIYMHRMIMRLRDGTDNAMSGEDLVVHHKNGNTLDNRKANMEILSRSSHTKTHNKQKIKP